MAGLVSESTSGVAPGANGLANHGEARTQAGRSQEPSEQ